MPSLLLALPLILAQSAFFTPAPVDTDTLLWARIDSVTHAFFQEWRLAWAVTQYEPPRELTGIRALDRARRIVGDDLRNASLRVQAAHCHYAETPRPILPFLIRGSITAHASCPLWYPDGLPPLEDERLYLDGALKRPLRPRPWAHRLQVRAMLDSMAVLMPSDVALTGQRVRFALDGGALRDAWGIATSCTVPGPACGLLRGLVLHRGGHASLADSTFQAALGGMPEHARCAWNDLGVLLEPEKRAWYAGLSCAERAAFEAKLWWLADPLYLEPGNERRAEHFARKVQVALVVALGDDGRQHFARPKGGEAVIETLERYGWPAQMHWAGSAQDRGHDGWLQKHGADTAGPYVVREYTRGRLHVLPAASALDAPFAAAPTDWQLNQPVNDYSWWPVEHYARDRSRIVQLPLGQSVMLRRHGATRFAWAAVLDSVLLGRPPGREVAAVVFESRAIGEVADVAAVTSRVGTPLRVDVRLEPGPMLLGIEIAGDSVQPAARTRYGMSVLESLTALGAGQALSQPLLFQPAEDEGATPRIDADQAVARMYGSTSFPRLSRLGVYWEGYGFAASDTIEVDLHAVRQGTRGLAGRVGEVLGIGQDPNASVGLRWRDVPGSARAVQVREGSVPVQMRSVVLDVSRLSRGTYRLTLSMQSPGRSPVTSERTFELR